MKNVFHLTFNYTATVSPTRGSMLGGTVMTILSSKRISPTTRITCTFDSIAVSGARVSTTEAICITPKLPTIGPMELGLLIDNVEIQTNRKIFHSRKTEDTLI